MSLKKNAQNSKKSSREDVTVMGNKFHNPVTSACIFACKSISFENSETRGAPF